MYAVAASVKHIFCDGHHNSGSSEFRGDLGDCLGIGVSRCFAKGQGWPREEGTLEIVRLEVWEMWYADVNVDACQELGLITSEQKTEAMRMRLDPAQH